MHCVLHVIATLSAGLTRTHSRHCQCPRSTAVRLDVWCGGDCSGRCRLAFRWLFDRLFDWSLGSVERGWCETSESLKEDWLTAVEDWLANVGEDWLVDVVETDWLAVSADAIFVTNPLLLKVSTGRCREYSNFMFGGSLIFWSSLSCFDISVVQSIPS